MYQELSDKIRGCIIYEIDKFWIREILWKKRTLNNLWSIINRSHNIPIFDCNEQHINNKFI